MSQPLPPSRFRRVAKWVGLLVCGLILLLWTALTQASLIQWRDSTSIVWREGSVHLFDMPNWIRTRGWRTSWDAYDDPALKQRNWHQSLGLRLPLWGVGQYGLWNAIIPLWMPFTLAAIPTAILWRRDRRTVQPGYCVKCGYDLRASKKVCPECGENFHRLRG